MDEKEYYRFVYRAVDRLNHFPAESAAAELRRRFASISEHAHLVRYLSLLGRFGTPADGAIAHQYLDAEDDLLANVACETFLNLTDPILVPQGWREL